MRLPSFTRLPGFKSFLLKNLALLFIVSLFLNLASGIALYYFYFQKEEIARQKYPFLSDTSRDQNETDLLINFLPLRTTLREIAKSYGDTFSFYFEYLPTGTSIGIREKEDYNPASLLKVPLVMALFLHQEKTNQNQDQVVEITQSEIDNRFGSLWQKGAGSKISLSEAARIAITQSDNTAAAILADHIPQEDYQDIYEGLDIEFPKDNQVRLSAKGYSSILKALFFASALSLNNSEKILELLTQTEFSDKLVSPIPKNIKVAHKIGVLGDELFQDCGIVYLPKRPYLLCMISKSSNSEAQQRMSAFSQIIYEYVLKASP